MTSHQLLDLRNTLERARDDKVAELKQVEAECKAIIRKAKKSPLGLLRNASEI